MNREWHIWGIICQLINSNVLIRQENQLEFLHKHKEKIKCLSTRDLGGKQWRLTREGFGLVLSEIFSISAHFNASIPTILVHTSFPINLTQLSLRFTSLVLQAINLKSDCLPKTLVNSNKN